MAVAAAKVKAKIEQEKGRGDVPLASRYEMTAEAEWQDAVARYEVLKRIVKYAEGEIDKMKGDIELPLIAEGVDAVLMPQGWVVKRGSGRTASKISATRLVELGVSVDLIAEATEEGREYTYAQVVVPKDKAHPIRTWDDLMAAMPAEAREGVGL